VTDEPIGGDFGHGIIRVVDPASALEPEREGERVDQVTEVAGLSWSSSGMPGGYPEFANVSRTSVGRIIGGSAAAATGRVPRDQREAEFRAYQSKRRRLVTSAGRLL